MPGLVVTNGGPPGQQNAPPSTAQSFYYPPCYQAAAASPNPYTPPGYGSGLNPTPNQYGSAIINQPYQHGSVVYSTANSPQTSSHSATSTSQSDSSFVSQNDSKGGQTQAIPERFYFSNGRRWEQSLGDAETAIKASYRLWTQHPTKMVQCTFGSFWYTIDWNSQVQMNQTTGTRRSLAWQDLTTGQLATPVYPFAPPMLQHCVETDLQDALYEFCRSRFEETMAQSGIKTRIVRISKVFLSPEKEELYNVSLRWLEKKRGNANVACCWHGSSAASIEKILENGFGAFTEARHGRKFGDGLYLGMHALASQQYAEPDADGVHHMLLCEAALGNLELSCKTMVQPSSSQYDSGTNDLANPVYAVIWSMNLPRVLPKVVISYIDDSHPRYGG